MRNNAPAFKFNDDDSVPVGYKHITCNMIFEIKMVGLVRKARYVASGHLTDPPVDSVYSSIVTRESVRILFTIAALNDLDVLGADVQNAYINELTKEKVYTTAGPELGSNQGRPILIVRALYGLKSSGARWRDHLAAILRENGFQSSLADPDVWMRKARKPCGFLYWEYLLAYVDDILVLSHAPHAVIESLSQHVTFKPGSVEEPKNYLGADVFKVTVHDGSPNEPAKQVWAMSASEYIKHSIQEVERELALQEAYLPKKIETPISSGYRPELDFSPELDGSQINYFQGLIGVLRWIVELGRIDIIVPVLLLSRIWLHPGRDTCSNVTAFLLISSNLIVLGWSLTMGSQRSRTPISIFATGRNTMPMLMSPFPQTCLNPSDMGFLLRVLLTPIMLVVGLHDDLKLALLFTSTRPQLFGIPSGRILWSLQLLAPNLLPSKLQLIISMVCAIN
jgi:hypothetical protein